MSRSTILLGLLLPGLVLAGLVLAGPGTGANLQPGAGRKPPTRRDRLGQFRGNGCVECHSRLTTPLEITSHFYDWLGSRHEVAGISCDKCHGGNPRMRDLPSAHAGVLSPDVAESSLHSKRLISTCGDCHAQISTAFSESTHYRKLDGEAGAPSCTTCHQHMATSVINWPPQTVKLCASCHNEKGSAPHHLTQPKRAGEVIAALSRAEEIIDWSGYIIDSSPRQKKQLRYEVEKLHKLRLELEKARVDWHEFKLEATRQQADEVFQRGFLLKEAIWKKVPAN